MEFLDKIGLKKFWTKIKTNFGTSVFRVSEGNTDPYGNHIIQFVTNHQIVNIDSEKENQLLINLFKWFKNASIGGIIEIIPTVNVTCDVYCFDPNYIDRNSYIYMMENTTDSPIFVRKDSVFTNYNTYLRLIKIDNDKLVVACRIKNI